MEWPPLLERLKVDRSIDDSRDDPRLESVLAAAVAFVERVRGGDFDFSGDPDSLLPPPPDDVVVGTVRLAGRWHERGRSPDGLISMGELGTARVPSFDPDIERLLGIGRYRGPVIA
ncbi:hypothetical protein [Pseudonocardia pini]|uniref:hypothetical protein n=1 Tax=Pseudonocardia pini TaxID=2758030 RepID=UPI0015F0F240|nr:hypothetical protein [Pseudonocardia pini]